MPRPVWRTTAPRTNPSVGFMQTQRTRPSPICWATSPVTVMVSPSITMSISTAWLISGNECGGNSTSTTGPAIATTRPVSRVVLSGAMVICCSLSRAERFGAAHDFHDFGGDRVLAGSVHDAAQRLAEFIGVVGRCGHGALLTGVERCRTLQQGREDLTFESARRQVEEQLLDFWFEFGVALQDLRTIVHRHLGHGQRQRLLNLDCLGGGRKESSRHQQDLLGIAIDEWCRYGAGDESRISEGRAVSEADEGLFHFHSAEAEIGRSFLSHAEQPNRRSLAAKAANKAFTCAKRRRVIRTRESAVTGDDDDDRRFDVVGSSQQLCRTCGIAESGLEDDAAHTVAVRTIRDDARL